MSLTMCNQFQKYESRLSSIFTLLRNGLVSLSVFVTDLEAGFVGIGDEICHIKTKLDPSIKKTQSYYGSMMEEADKLLQQINNDFESCILDIKVQRDKINEINCELGDVQIHLQQKVQDVRDAECQCVQKNQELFHAESALRIASQNLEDAQSRQIGAIIGGYTATTVSLMLTFVFPPALIGVFGGTATTVAGLTVLQDRKNECSNRQSTAINEVSASKTKLELAKNTKTTIERQLSDLQVKKNSTEQILNDKKRLLEKIQKYQKDIIELNTNIKRLYSMLCDFCGSFNVLCCETKGGYQLDSLKSPTLNVCNSLFSLLNCDVIQLSCDHHQLECMKGHLLQIQRIKWPSLTYEENDLI